MIIANNEELQVKCEEWQKILRLQDWNVVAKIKRQSGVKENSQAHCSWTIQNKQATVIILDPIDYPEDLSFPQDMEHSLVHELLHLHFCPFDDEVDTPKEIAIEQAVDLIACALIKLHRAKEGDSLA